MLFGNYKDNPELSRPVDGVLLDKGSENTFLGIVQPGNHVRVIQNKVGDPRVCQ